MGFLGGLLLCLSLAEDIFYPIESMPGPLSPWRYPWRDFGRSRWSDGEKPKPMVDGYGSGIIFDSFFFGLIILGAILDGRVNIFPGWLISSLWNMMIFTATLVVGIPRP